MLLPDLAFNPPEADRMAAADDHKSVLHRYLRTGREALLWKLDGLGSYDARRPMTPTGTNVLGLVKHLTAVESGYFGVTFGRPFPEQLPWAEEDAEPNADMWATPDESREQVVGLYRRVWVHADATIDAVPLDGAGEVPWWPPERREVTLQQVLVHVVAETHRHAGHADVVRELVDGAVGLRDGNDNLPTTDVAWWSAYRERLEQLARDAADRWP